jgi:hypothetical protein
VQDDRALRLKGMGERWIVSAFSWKSITCNECTEWYNSFDTYGRLQQRTRRLGIEVSRIEFLWLHSEPVLCELFQRSWQCT